MDTRCVDEVIQAMPKVKVQRNNIINIFRDSSISNLADTISSLEKQVAQMTSEKDDLLVKVQNLS